MRLVVLFLLCAAGGITCSPLSFLELVHHDLHAQSPSKRELSDHPVGNGALSRTGISLGRWKRGRESLNSPFFKDFEQKIRSRRTIDTRGVSCQSSRGGTASAFSSSGGSCGPGNNPTAQDGTTTVIVPALGGGSSNGANSLNEGASNAGTNTLVGGIPSSVASTGNTGGNQGPGDPNCNNGWGSYKSTGINPIGCEICGNDGCGSQEEYCSFVLTNAKIDPVCPGGSSGQRTSQTNTNPVGSTPTVIPGNTNNVETTPSSNNNNNNSPGLASTGGTQGCNQELGGAPNPVCNGQTGIAYDSSSRMMARQNNRQSSGGGGGGGDYLATINSWRQKFCLAPYQKNAQLEANAAYQGKQSQGSVQHMSENPCPGSAQVMAGGTGAGSIDLAAGIWLCEVRTKNIDGCTCKRFWDQYRYSKNGQERGHFDLLVGQHGKEYSQIGCAFTPLMGSQPGATPALTGLWTCTLGNAGYTNCRGAGGQFVGPQRGNQCPTNNCG